MKIAFVGKGGSGKSTMTALFIRYLQAQGRKVMAIDADLNMNLAGLLAVDFPQDKVLAAPAIADGVRDVLRGTNARITDNGKFLPTTPPGAGSHIVTRYDDPALGFCSVDVGAQTRLLTVGTYDGAGIGQTCYHSHLFVAENLLTHCMADDYDIVCDMVAGTDAFAYSLHLQFDAIILIAEPTPESAEVCALYMDLARESGIEGLVHLVGNKIEDEDDLAFIRERTGMEPLAHVPTMRALKKARQRGAAVTADMVDGPVVGVMAAIDKAAAQPSLSPQQRFEKLLALHEVLNGKQWVKLAYGDVMGQVDPDFRFDRMTMENAA